MKRRKGFDLTAVLIFVIIFAVILSIALPLYLGESAAKERKVVLMH
jgi:Tfp pilus assembly major pilin PilA